MPDSVYFTKLVEGNMIEAIIQVFTDLMSGWFWVWFFGLSLLMLYNRTRDFASVVVIGIAIMVHIFPLIPPEAHLFVYILLAIGVANILYKVYN